MFLKESFFKFSFLYKLIPVSSLMKLSRKETIYPFYHFIKENNDIITSHLYKTKNKEEFIKDIKFFKKHFQSISVKNVLENEKAENKLKFFLSFDDGLSNFYSIVMPILIKEKVFAINFINTDFIDNKNLFFRYKINLLIQKILENKLTKQQKIKTKKEIGNKQLNIKYLKTLKYSDTVLIDKLCEHLSISINDFLKNYKPYLTTEQINDLIAKGFHIGGHSKSHPYYADISYKEQLKETLECMSFIKNKFKLQNNFFSFPFSDNGVSYEFFKNLENKNIITFGTAGIKDEVNQIKNIQRISMEYKKVYSAETIIKGELILYILKRIFNKNKIIRK